MPNLRSLLLGFLCTALTAIGLTAADFEGTIAMTIKEGSRSHDVSYATKGGKLRISMAAGPMGEVNSIVDLAAGKILMLMPAQGMYMEMPVGNEVNAVIAEHTPDSKRLKRTDKTTKILGYTCRQYLFDEDAGPVEIWATDELGQFVALPRGNPMQQAKTKAGWDQFIDGDFFPMRVVALNHQGKERMRWEVSGVKPQKLSPALFTVPAGLKKFDMGGMMQGLGGLLGN